MGEFFRENPIGWYVDDVICAGKTGAECTDVTGLVIRNLTDAGFTLNSRKCCFNQSSIVLLGRVFDGYKKTTEESVEKVRAMKPP